jgi:hypothetical protein
MVSRYKEVDKTIWLIYDNVTPSLHRVDDNIAPPLSGDNK